MKEINTFRKFLTEEEEEGNKIPEAALILPRGEKIILQAEEQDYKRGLIVELTDEGGYKINYWYGDDVKVYPAEVEVDGVSIKDDANEVYIKFHPELKENITEEFDELDDRDKVKEIKQLLTKIEDLSKNIDLDKFKYDGGLGIKDASLIDAMRPIISRYL